MVRVQIPLDSPVGKGKDEEHSSEGEEVGVMSDSDPESDVDDDIGDPDWDEVEKKNNGFNGSIDPIDINSLPQNGVTIQLAPDRPKRRQRRKGKKGSSDDDEQDGLEQLVDKPKKKRRMDINEMIRKSINRVKITEQLMRHKLSLLLYMARGMRLVKIINSNIIKALSLSITVDRMKIKSNRNEKKWLEAFLKKFGDIVRISSDDDKRESHMKQPFVLNLLKCYSDLEVTSLMELVVMFVGCLKAVKPDLPARIVNVLRPITLRADIIVKPPSPEESTEKVTEDFTMFDKKPKTEVIKTIKPKKEPEIVDLTEDVVERLDFWVEVYIKSEDRWICIDLCNLTIDEPTVLVELSQPFNYMVTYDVDRYCIKAAEKYYCQNWYSRSFKKGRCDDKWWDGLLESMGPTKKSSFDAADDNKTDDILLNQEMPTSDNGFRNHPIYVLEKHLLKFQGIYPPEVPPLGYFKDQPIYPRDCVHTLRSRDTWLRQAKSVKLNETPYKVVKARPKRDRYSGELIRDLPLELFGEWQTKDYEPPEAKDGVVPRNCYGNVDMWQECMLPKGCSWLKLPGLPRVANKLGLDCAAAVVGFDNNCGYGSHPVTDGFIVCQEHAETLRMAWEEEQENTKQREEAKRQKKIWDNWKRLIKAALIREKLRVKYQNS